MNMMMLSKTTIGTPPGQRRSLARPKISECLPPTTPTTPPRTLLDEAKERTNAVATGTPPISRRRRKKQISGLSGMFADKEGTSNNKNNEISDTDKACLEQQPSVFKTKPAIFSDPHPDPDAAKRTDHAGRTPLHVAVALREGLEVVERLLDAYPAAAEVVDGCGMTPLMLACEQGRHADRQIIKALVRASPTTVLYENDEGMTALECCLVTEVPLAIFKMMRKVCAWEQRRRAEREKRDALEAHREMNESMRSLSLSSARRSSSEDQTDGKDGSFSDMDLPTFVEPSPPQVETNEMIFKINSPSSVKFSRRTSAATHLQVVASSA